MKNVIFISVFLLSSCATTPKKVPNWVTTIPKSLKYKYYVGHSTGGLSKNEAIVLAFQRVYEEAVRDNFGTKVKISKKIKQTLKELSLNNDIEELSDQVILKGFRQTKIFFKQSKNGAWQASVLYQYSKKEIAIEKKRQGIPKLNKSLFYAIKTGNIQLARKMLEGGANPNCKKYINNKKISALYLAVENNRASIAEELVNKGADIDWRILSKLPSGEIIKKHGALHLALTKGYKKISKMLIAKGANTNLDGGMRGRPLYLAIEKGYKEIIKILLHKGADPTIRPSLRGAYGDNALAIASYTGNVEIFKILLTYKSMHTPIYMEEALRIASARGHKNIVEVLLSNGVFLDGTDPHDGGTALHYAVVANYLPIVNLLLSGKSNPNTKAKFGKTPLHAAVRSGRVNTVRVLIAKGG